MPYKIKGIEVFFKKLKCYDKSDWKNIGEDHNVHYFKSISEHEG